MILLIALFVVGWVAASVLGTMAYFLGEQSKPIHERNWKSQSFAQLAENLTGKKIDYSSRVPAFPADAYASQTLPTA